ncbi:hypothetical protein AB0D54_17205 [Streptomyces xanthophaeus]|uniref:hypothetical protein n=1 Tax=Streptomyces xanthophaeus TaxID=67385 RepID=UPI003426640E
MTTPAPRPSRSAGPMSVCGDDMLAVRLAGELRDICRQDVTLMLPDADADADADAPARWPPSSPGPARSSRPDGLLFRATERTPRQRREATAPGLCTLALLSSTTDDPHGADGSDRSGPAGPQLLPASMEIARSAQRGAVVLEAVPTPRTPPGGAGSVRRGSR